VTGPLVIVPQRFDRHYDFLVESPQASQGQLERVCECCKIIYHGPYGSRLELTGVEPATCTIDHCHCIQSSADLSANSSGIAGLRSAMPRIDGVSSVRIAQDWSMKAVELAFHLEVTPGWLFGRKKKVKRRPELASEKQYSGAKLLWESVVRCRPVSEQERVQHLVHIPLAFSFRRPRFKVSTKR
jgi:hypothetical protein